VLTQKERSLVESLEKRATDKGIEIVTVEIVGAKKAPTIRVYIDIPDGVGFDELSSSQVWINEVVDELDPFPGAYTLEVSSPGIDRPLRTVEHFQRFKGSTVVIQTVKPIEGRSKWTGILGEATAEYVSITIEDTTTEIDFNNIKRAQLKGTIEFNS
jgi:ribosome maturation factor RimP